MHRMLVVFCLAAYAQAQTPAHASVLATVHQFVDGFNQGDTKAALAACDEQTSIIDEFPPHEWHGTGACAQWMNDFDADARKNGSRDGVVTLSNPWHVDINGDRAYVVIPANYTFKQHGKPVAETGSIITLTLRKRSAGWRITGWSWAKH